jgi:Arc/MetJ-type ribon-helix-helix transcriptional regulator
MNKSGCSGDRHALSAAASGSMMNHRTAMPKTKVALTLDAALLQQVDELVERRRFRNRSQAIEAALADKLRRLARTRLATESAKLHPRDERRLADEGLVDDLAAWPEY